MYYSGNEKLTQDRNFYNTQKGTFIRAESHKPCIYRGKIHFNFDFLLPLLFICLDFETLPNLSPLTPSKLRKSLLFSSLPLIPACDSVSLLRSALSEFRSMIPLTACFWKKFYFSYFTCCFTQFYRHGSNWRLWEKPFSIFEFSIPFVRGRVWQFASAVQITIPSSYNVSI